MSNKDNYLIEHFFLEINGINLIKYTPQVQQLGNGELEQYSASVFWTLKTSIQNPGF